MTARSDGKDVNKDLHPYLALLLKSEAWRFGQFKTKSGRLSPYFFNSGALNQGEHLAALGQLYGDFVQQHWPKEEALYLYGPAYKGIPLVTITAAHLAAAHGRKVFATYNRKEKKDHGEGGSLVGYPYAGKERVIIIEDVLTGGTSARESLESLKSLGVQVEALVVGVDRQEKGRGELLAADELTSDFGMRVEALLTLDDIVGSLKGREVMGRRWIDDDHMQAIEAYRAQYGV